MRAGYKRCSCWLLLCGLLAGCAGNPGARPESGAKEVVIAYFEALIGRDWPRAYAALDAASRARVTQDEFVQLAKNYRDLGFEPEAVKLRSCEEHASEAVAHVVLIGKAGTKSRRYRDSVALRRTGEEWRIILPPSFGRKRPE